MSHVQILELLRVDTPQPISNHALPAVPQDFRPAPQPVTLLADLFTLLCLLRQSDVRVSGQRFLTPAKLADINRHLLRPESPPTNRWRKERDTTWVRLLHFLADAAGLVAPTSGYIKPTPAAADWLRLPPQQQRDRLRDCICAQRNSLSLWHTYQWSGWHLIQNGVSLAELFTQIEHASKQGWLDISQLYKLIPVHVMRSHPDAQPQALVHGFIQILDELGLIDWCDPTHIRLRPQPHPPITSQLQLQLPNESHPRQLDRPLNQYLPALYDISEYCNISVSQAICKTMVLPALAETQKEFTAQTQRSQLAQSLSYLCFTLDPARCQHALARGVSPREIQVRTQIVLGEQLPSALIRNLHAWQRHTKQLTVSRSLLLESPDPDLINNLTKERGIRACFDRTLSSRAVTLKEDQLPNLLRRLAWRDISPTLQGSLSDPDQPAASAKHGSVNFDQATLAHLYLSAKLCHLLPDVLPIPYRLPFAVLADIESQLSPHDLGLAQTIIDRTVADLARQQSKLAADSIARTAVIDESAIQDDDWPHPASAYAQYIASIEQAIAKGSALAITYFSPDHDGLTDRIIEPLRIEHAGPRTYIIAYCRQAQAQRTFRLDRIRSLRE